MKSTRSLQFDFLSRPLFRGRTISTAALIAALACWLLAAGWLCLPFAATSGEAMNLGERVLMTGVIPWGLLFVGICCGLFGCNRSDESHEPEWFATLTVLTLWSVWWLGTVVQFWDVNVLEASASLAMESLSEWFGSGNWWIQWRFTVLGPTLNPLQLQEPISLIGWNFPIVLLSTLLLTAYLYLLGRWTFPAINQRKLSGAVKLSAGLTVLWTPAFVRLGLMFAEMVQRGEAG